MRTPGRMSAVLVCITLVLFGVWSPATSAVPTPGGRVTVALSAGWDVLDPAATAFTLARDVMGNIYDPLLIRDFKTGEILPNLAQSWSVSRDGKVITLKLRRGVTFQDDTPFNAQAVLFTLKRITDPELKSPMANTILGPVEKIEAPDDVTVVITLKQPFAPFLDSLTEISLAPVSPTAVQKYGKDFGHHPVGTGVFMFKSEVPGQQVTLVRNPRYRWAPTVFQHGGPAYLDELTYMVVTEDATRMAMLERGEAQVVYNPPNRDVRRLQQDTRYKVFFKDRPGLPRVVVMNTSRWPFDDVRVRQAVAYAIDKETILKAVYEGIGDVAHGFLTPGTASYWKGTKDADYAFNPDKARQLLQEAGWRPGPDGILAKDGKPFRVKFWTTTVPQQIQDAQVRQAMLRPVGIDAQIVQVEQAAFLAGIRKGEPDMAGMLFVSSDPDVLYTVAHSSQIERGWNTAYYRNPELDRVLEEGRVTTDPARRAELYQRAQQILLRDVPYVPYYVITNPYITSASLSGFKLDVRAFMMFYDASVSR